MDDMNDREQRNALETAALRGNRSSKNLLKYQYSFTDAINLEDFNSAGDFKVKIDRRISIIEDEISQQTRKIIQLNSTNNKNRRTPSSDERCIEKPRALPFW